MNDIWKTQFKPVADANCPLPLHWGLCFPEAIPKKVQ